MASMWGESHDRKMAEFDKQVEAIEAKYSVLLNKNNNRFTNEPPDRLANHFIIQSDPSKYQIGFDKNTYLPEIIQIEVIEAFKSAFSEK